jgi:nitrite reductase/ring-hydroxylating ferredoxin subunit/uncharacterized membrane protein
MKCAELPWEGTLSMSKNISTEVIERQEWLDPMADAVQQTVQNVYRKSGEPGRQVEDALHGVWLGHPLHSALTDLPIGAWTTAVLIDLLESASNRRELRAGADAAVGIGLIGAVGAAVTGLTDYQHVDGNARRVGIVHGILNLVTTSIFAGSYFARKRGSRGAGKILGLLGIGIGMAAAKLGGDLVFSHKIGVDHTEKDAFPVEFTPVMNAADLKDGDSRRLEVNGQSILLVKRGERIFGLAETCSHLGGPLSEGKIDNSTVQCPWHGSCFALEDGQVLNGPAVYNQPSMEVRVAAGQIEIRRRIDQAVRRTPGKAA